ncbi:phosducin-like protein isoform X4 [Paralichthys olivaceus]|uniref:phosducin-like protein isoform X4 n=1 Tax=Paralichthys olivaceus TaxID=8255 RepID=UPI0037510102
MRSSVLGSVCVLLLLLREPACLGDEVTSSTAARGLPQETHAGIVNPCCYFPCQHWGVCVRYTEDKYECDCTRTGFQGENCTVPEFWTRVRLFFKPSPDVVHYILTHFHWLWDIINHTFLREVLMRLVLTVRSNLIPSPPTFNSKYSYLSWESYYNVSYYTRLLPPVPADCPTPMGVKGKASLPDPELLVEKLLKRRTFRPDPQGSNLMFAFFAQHFTHQFFKTYNRMGLGFTKALAHGVDAGHIYGDNLKRQLQLRLHKDGKLKYQLIDGEVYPPSVADAPVKMSYPPGVPPEHQIAIGQEVYGLLPGLGMYATLWLREHNRVCDILKAEHPIWDDEQLFQTSRLIIIGETIKIVIEEYVQHLSGYLLQLKFDPTLLFSAQFQYSNRIALEFSQLYHWHPLMPDSFFIDGDELSYPQFLFNTSVLTHYGIEKLVDAFSRQVAGQIGGGHNINAVVTRVAVGAIKESRQLRIQPFNEYRKRFNLKPYTSFKQFTDNEEIASMLEEYYGDIDALEFYPGLMLERTRPKNIFGESMVEMGAPFSLKGLLGNPLCSPNYWKPSTFGGKVGFDIVNSATLKKLVCLNTRTCPYVAFRVPTEEKSDSKYDDSDVGSSFSGPKGVINDWRKYKQLEVEQKQEQKKEMERLIKKLHINLVICYTLQMTMQEYNMLQEDEDDEDFLQHYRMQRIEEMRRQLCRGKRFEQVYELTSGEDFLEALDKEDKSTLVMIHIYEPDIPGCEAMSGSLLCLAQEYPLVKFCSVRSSAISTSALFRDSALPALLVYKEGDLIGNFVRLTDQLGEDFFAVDLEALLQEYGLLPDKPPMVPKTVRNGAIIQNIASDEDSDLDID